MFNSGLDALRRMSESVVTFEERGPESYSLHLPLRGMSESVLNFENRLFDNFSPIIVKRLILSRNLTFGLPLV